jgi:phage terminase small subunit
MQKIPLAPKHLRPETRVWWRAVVRDWTLEEHHRRLLTLLAECWDRVQEAREKVEKDGAYLPDRFGQMRAHPALSVERQEMVAFARLLRELDLDVTPPPEPPRPARLRRYQNATHT